MRVSIQYSVDLERVPEEMQRLIDATVIESMDVVGHGLRDLFCHNDAEQALTTIHEARQALLAVDERLSDVDSILRGYITQKAALVQEGGEPPPAEEIPTMSDTGEAVMMPASQDTMKMVQATLAAHRAETDALRRTMNLGFESVEGEGEDDGD